MKDDSGGDADHEMITPGNGHVREEWTSLRQVSLRLHMPQVKLLLFSSSPNVKLEYWRPWALLQ
jgi:hypothetical protein